jgi:hypothetical protein
MNGHIHKYLRSSQALNEKKSGSVETREGDNAKPDITTVQSPWNIQ